ncbi:ATP-binding protein [Asticcacaulis sp.]|uniref:ATP-binding protein n=1 Tax=Asticcacaulis sp. TaxID=1872648 RepID=UPI003F7BCBC1
MEVIALIGLSGVGKSTVLANLATEVDFLHLQASQLLKDGFARQKLAPPSSEELRLGEVVNNQRLLIDSFHAATGTTAKLVILDGHLLIDGKSGITEIPATVFADIGVSKLIFLYAQPEAIAERRNKDVERLRPTHSISEIASHQAHEIRLASEAAVQLGIPLLICSNQDRAQMVAFLSISKR